MITGHPRKRGRYYSAVIDFGRDPATGKRLTRSHALGLRDKRAAQREVERLVQEYRQTGYSAPSRMTLGEYLERWLTDYAKPNCAPKTFDTYRMFVRAYLAPALGAHLLQKLQPTDIQTYYVQALESGRIRGEGGLSPQTVLHHHRLLHSALQQAVRWRLIPYNPAAGVRPPRVERSQRGVLDADGLVRLLRRVEGERLHLPILITITTGLRRGEILGLRWQDVDLQSGTIAVRQAASLTKDGGLEMRAPKTLGSRRVVALPTLLVEELVRHRGRQAEARLAQGVYYQDHGLVCPNPDGTPQSPDGFGGAFAGMMAKSGLPHVTFHDLRHCHATLLLLAKINAKVVSERLGHGTIRLTMDTYSHVMPHMQDEAATAVDQVLRTALAKASPAAPSICPPPLRADG